MNYKKKYLKYKLKYLNLKKKMKGGGLEGMFDAYNTAKNAFDQHCESVCKLGENMTQNCKEVCSIALSKLPLDDKTIELVSDEITNELTNQLKETVDGYKRMGNYAVGALTGLTAEQWLILKELYDTNPANFLNNLREKIADAGADFALSEGIQKFFMNLNQKQMADFFDKASNFNMVG